MTDLKKTAIEAALKAGHFLKNSFHKTHEVTSKEGKKNLVTDCDLESERIILSFLHKTFPSHGFLSEEAGKEGSNSSEITWVIDPLDGTVNFAYQIPLFTVSIAACRGEEVLAGVVFQPMSEELFVAEKGKGAFLNGKQIHVSKQEDMEEAFLAVGFPYDLSKDPAKSIHPLLAFLNQGLPIRRLGSAALDLSYVASGRFDAFFEADLSPWDVAAGLLLVQEAGGKTSEYNGKKRSPLEKKSLLASNGFLHEQMLNTIQGKNEVN